MDRLEAMKVLTSVVDEGSFSEASRRLGIPLTTISRRVSELERYLNAQLLSRSTRTLRLTDVGAVYYASCKEVLSRIAEAEKSATEGHGIARGAIVVTAPLFLVLQTFVWVEGAFGCLLFRQTGFRSRRCRTAGCPQSQAASGFSLRHYAYMHDAAVDLLDWRPTRKSEGPCFWDAFMSYPS
ncbi:LysR family transcriptional regulator [Cupriavidus sp. 8B]